MKRRLFLGGLASLLLVAVLAPGALATRNVDFFASMSPRQEVGEVNAPKAHGFAAFRVDGNVLHYRVTVSNLTGPATQTHIHGPAERGVNASISIWLCGTATNPGPAGTPLCSSATDGGLVQGSIEITTEQLAMIDAGLAYVNVHTALHPSGEIRGQIRPVR